MRIPPKGRHWFTFRLFAEDHELLKTLTKRQTETKDRHSALLALVPIVQSLSIPKIEKRERKALRIGIPDELYDELERIKDETGHSMTDIILIAAREYAQQHPLPNEVE